MFKFNIGSAVNGIDKALVADEVIHALHYEGFTNVEVIKTAMSETETTYVVVASDRVDYAMRGHRAAVYAVCEALQQDAIAYTLNGTGYLVGPKADDWGDVFLQEHFIE